MKKHHWKVHSSCDLFRFRGIFIAVWKVFHSSIKNSLSCHFIHAAHKKLFSYFFSPSHIQMAEQCLRPALGISWKFLTQYIHCAALSRLIALSLMTHNISTAQWAWKIYILIMICVRHVCKVSPALVPYSIVGINLRGYTRYKIYISCDITWEE